MDPVNGWALRLLRKIDAQAGRDFQQPPRFKTRQLFTVVNRAYGKVFRVLRIVSLLPIDGFAELEEVELAALAAFSR